MNKQCERSVLGAVLFEITLILGGVYLLVFDMPVLARWFYGYCILMGALRIFNFIRQRRKAAKR